MVSSVEPRGIEPLYPSVKRGFLTVRWPLKLHKENYIMIFAKQKARSPLGFRTSGNSDRIRT